MIYFDNAATTRSYNEIQALISEYNTQKFFNPSALYSEALNIKKEIDEARKSIAHYINARPSELYFVSSGSEANNTILRGIRYKNDSEIVISAVEHPSVYNTAKQLQANGLTVKLVKVNRFGEVIADELLKNLTRNTALVSIIHVSNETAQINDIADLVKQVKSYSSDILFHSDGVQAFCKIDTDMRMLGVDAYTISAHKIGGVKGISGMYIKKGTIIKPLITGGEQENAMRASTENVSGIMAFAKAAELSQARKAELEVTASAIFDIILRGIQDIPNILINRSEKSAPHILSIAIKGVRGEVLLRCLNKRCFIVGTGSACSSRKSGSRIVDALGIPHEYKDGMLRISVSYENTIEEAEQLVTALKEEIRLLRI